MNGNKPAPPSTRVIEAFAEVNWHPDFDEAKLTDIDLESYYMVRDYFLSLPRPGDAPVLKPDGVPGDCPNCKELRKIMGGLVAAGEGLSLILEDIAVFSEPNDNGVRDAVRARKQVENWSFAVARLFD